jgi:hypothetical protein
MKRFLLAVTLICLISVSALAGDMPTVGAPAPASSPMQSSAAVSVLLKIISLVVR